MAVINYTVERVTTEKDPCHVLTWTELAGGDSGQPVEMPGSADRTVQVFGTFGDATCRIEGSNNGFNWATLTDPQGNTLDITSEKIETITEITRFMRPRIPSGSGVSLTICMLVRRDL